MRKLKVLFVVDRIGFAEILSIPTLSAVAKRAGHHVELIEFGRNESTALRYVDTYRPDVVAYSVCSTEIGRYLEINAHIKSRGSCLSVFGGPHPTFFPALINEQHVDAICRGEGDVAFPQFLDQFRTGEFQASDNFSVKPPDGTVRENLLGPLVQDLDGLPFPDRDLVYSKHRFLKLSPVKSFFAGRGCPFRCTYCFNHAYHDLYRGKGPIIRTKTVPYLIEELQSVSVRYPLAFVKFQDDVFGVKRTWLEEFVETYPGKIGLPFMCYANPNMVTRDYARLLKQAGCYSVCMAIESGNETIRKQVLNRRMTDDRIVEAAGYLKENGIRLYMVNMLGLPTETEEDMIRTIKLNRAARSDFSDASIFQPYPGTRITQYCKDLGLLDNGKEDCESQFTTSVLNFDPNFAAKVRTVHRLFSIMVDHPRVQKLYPSLSRNYSMEPLLNWIYRLYYGINLHRRIYAAKIPFLLRLRGVLPLVFSRNRT